MNRDMSINLYFLAFLKTKKPLKRGNQVKNTVAHDIKFAGYRPY